MNTVPIESLSIHDALSAMPRLAEDDPRYLTMKATWDETGIIPPIYITKTHQIVDGRHRFWWAAKSGWEKVPVVIVKDEEIPMVIVNGVVGKNHSTKGQRAYIIAPYLSAALAAATHRRLQIVRAGGKRVPGPEVHTVDELADKLGLGREVLNQARRLHKLFAEDEDIKAEWEPKILAENDAIGLGSALAGIAGKELTKGKAAIRRAGRNTALHNWEVAWENLTTPAAKWDKWNEDERDHATGAMAKAVEKLPDPALDALIASCRVAKRNRAANPVTAHAE